MTRTEIDVDRRLELIAVLVMSLTAILTAWTGFQSAKWSGVMAIRFSESAAARTESIRWADEAGRQRSIDIALGLAWIDAYSLGDEERADFLEERFSEPLGLAFDAWVATRPLDDPDAPLTPFDMPEYVITADEESQRFVEIADLRSNEARDANQRSDNYVFLTIVFASVIFFAALSTKLTHPRSRIGLLGLAIIVLAAGAVVLSTYPVMY